MATAAIDRPTAPPRIGETSPNGGGIFGLLPALGRDPLGFLARTTHEYGDFVRLRLGFSPTIILGHPDYVEEVLVTRNHDFRKAFGTRRLGSLLGRGLLLSEGDFWLRQRRLMQPAFHRQRLSSMAETMVRTASETIGTWKPGAVRAINQEMMELTLRIVARTLFGTDVSGDLARIRSSSTVMSEHFRSRLFSMLTLLPDSVPTPGNCRYKRAVQGLDALVYRIVAERRANGGNHNDLLEMLLEARDDTGRGMEDRQLRDEIMTLLLAGHDTTALALTWAWVLLTRNPAAELRLHQELSTVLQSKAPRPEDAQRLPYTNHVISETLRLYPTAWVIAREALRDTQIGGHRVAKYTTVFMAPWVLHRDPRFWDDPESFKPERWAESNPPRYAYLPFGAGQRVCIGASFAQLEATLVLATIAQRFRLEFTQPNQRIEPWPVVTLRTRADVPMRLNPA